MQAYGAIVAGFARQRDADAALDVFRRFLAAGGSPDKMMFDTLVSLCIKCEQYKSARQVRGVTFALFDLHTDRLSLKVPQFDNDQAWPAINRWQRPVTVTGRGSDVAHASAMLPSETMTSSSAQGRLR